MRRDASAGFASVRQKLDRAASGISTACGLALEVTAFPGEHCADLITPNVTDASKAHKLTDVCHRNPNWIYPGETVGQIVGASGAMLRSCGLQQAGQALLRATAHG